MKTTITFFFLLLTATLYGQSGSHLKIFQKENFFNGWGKTIVTKDTFIVNSLINLDFYRKTYYIPYYYPKQFIDHQFKNQKHIEWADSTAKRDYKNNWTYTSKYDEKGRVTEYSYSSCFVCSQFAYTLKISYDDQDRPIKLVMGHDEHDNDGTTAYKVQDVYLLGYDLQGNITKLERYIYGKLAVRIIKM